jgi:peptidoglycan-associated lipoprotein
MKSAARVMSYGAIGIALGLLGACAHEQPAPVAKAPPPPKETVVVVVEPKVEVAEQPEDNIAEILKSTVVYFDFDKDILLPQSEEKLQRLGDVLQRHPKLAIQIQGNCDERGTEEYNLHLGERRAFAARQYLVGLGIDANRIDTISFGFEHPADPGHNEQAWAKNRRDEFVRTQAVSTR